MISSSWNYILWLFAFIWCPTVVLWFIDLGQVRSCAKAVLFGAIAIATICLPVEYWIVREVLVLHRGHYLGIYYLGIPLEDYLFFVSFPYLLAPLALKVDSLMSERQS